MRMPRWLESKLWRFAYRVIDSRPPDFLIGPPGDPYMERWYIFRGPKWMPGIYLHRFRHDDDDRALHDHPWPSLSFLLSGQVCEVFAAHGSDPKDPSRHSRRTLKAGDIIWRRASFSHRIEMESYLAITLFCIGPNIRQWGFWCPNIGWRHWRDYCSPNDEGRVGRGCE